MTELKRSVILNLKERGVILRFGLFGGKPRIICDQNEIESVEYILSSMKISRVEWKTTHSMPMLPEQPRAGVRRTINQRLEKAHANIS